VSLNSEDGKAALQVFEDNFFEDNQILIAALSTISKKERAAILLFEIGGFSIEEITAIQKEKSESTIKSRLSRTRKKLKEFMVTLENESKRGLNIAHKQRFLEPQKSTKDLYHETSKVIKEIKSIG
jgi:predicted RNA polymerase sigma factor